MFKFQLLKNHKFKTTGFVMVESLIAITIIVVGLLGIFSLLSQSLGLNRVVSDRYGAAYLAAEGIEIVKNLIDNNLINNRAWNSGLINGNYEADYNDLALVEATGRFLLYDDERYLYSYDVGNPTRFQRTINLQLLGGGEELKVNSKVDWITRGGADFSINLEDRFLNWR